MMQEAENIDWTGVSPSTEPIAPLTPESFVERLESMTRALRALDRLRTAFLSQHPEVADGLSVDSAPDGG